MGIAKVGVIGCGLMGSGIAQVCAQSGYATTVVEVDGALLEKGMGRIRKFLQGGVEKGKMTREKMEETLARLKGSTSLSDLKECDLVIEAAVENMAVKKKLFGELGKMCKPDTILSSNTSSLSITEMGAASGRIGKCIGFHFMNPVPIMKLVEIVRPETTSPETYETIRAFAGTLGKTVITAKDTPGFIVNVLLVPYLLDAIRALENGLATKEDIDTGMTLGCGHPMGPLTLTDFVGLDTTYFIAEAMYQEFKDSRYAAPPLLKRMV
ncbi:MAG: 3-hydroxybutyryl-CoA dehydrogenase, partial [Planctomycetes bacterium RBG_16_59_8]